MISRIHHLHELRHYYMIWDPGGGDEDSPMIARSDGNPLPSDKMPPTQSLTNDAS